MADNFDILVIGGGHAGVEAALVAARMGCRTALLSFSEKNIGQMSCNPAIGGLGKGQLVKEVDALFGEMGRAIDETGIQFRTLNTSKGPAVRSSRAQADRVLYCERIRKAIAECENLQVIEGKAGALLEKSGRISGIETEDGRKIHANQVILTTGTFLRGLMHTGEKKTIGGRVGEQAATTLSDSIASFGLRMGRMKTGTPPRLLLSSIDFSQLTEQPGDEPIKPFSFRTKEIKRKQISCWITATNEKTHDIIRANLARSPMFNGQIESCGPRYCPSLEDKIFRFADKNSHNIFLEPEGFESEIVYPNGISTSLPEDVQENFVRSIKGLENVVILTHGYAVEYDHVDPTELDRTFKVKSLQGLFLAGQINGTTGYEEAAAQGMLAGINAALAVKQKESLILGRELAYLGVLADDLTTLGVLEPYRMFTSRAEYRLQLREDNADSRLTPIARELGLVNELEWREFNERQQRIESEKQRLERTFLKPVAEHNAWLKQIGSAEIEDGLALAQLLRRPETTYNQIEQSQFAPSELLSSAESSRVEVELKFAGYLKRQEEEIQKVKKMEEQKIPNNMDFNAITGLSTEVKQRLSLVKPATLGQASRVSGVTPAAISLLAVHMKRESRV
jgi:tRNA uridine 5-carboxymethylaminomethyl modification enzyme